MVFACKRWTFCQNQWQNGINTNIVKSVFNFGFRTKSLETEAIQEKVGGESARAWAVTCDAVDYVLKITAFDQVGGVQCCQHNALLSKQRFDFADIQE